jgi:hypothetical protein
MANSQRTRNDLDTLDRREMADEMTKENRDRNDAITFDRRQRADRVMNEHRLKNDAITANRRKMNDRNPWRTFGISLLIIAALVAGAYYFLYLN